MKAKGVEIIIYEPVLKDVEFYRSQIVNDLAEFKRRSEVIVAKRRSHQLDDVGNKIYTRYLFGSD